MKNITDKRLKELVEEFDNLDEDEEITIIDEATDEDSSEEVIEIIEDEESNDTDNLTESLEHLQNVFSSYSNVLED